MDKGDENGHYDGENTGDKDEADQQNTNAEECDEGEKEEGNDMNEEVDKLKGEHFSQTKPDEFCSENFKIELGGLPKYFPLGQLKKLLNNTLQLDAHRVKPGALGRNVAYINFKDEDSRFKAITVLNGYKWQSCTLTAEKADPAKDPMLLAKIEFLKVPKKEHEMLPLEDRIQKAVTPYHDMPYEKQIVVKAKSVKNTLRKFGNELAQMNPELKKFVHWHKIRRKGQICEVDDMVHSPITEGYRNKCEFTIGKNNDGDKPVVGFRVASYKEGSVEVGPVGHLRHLNDKMKVVVKLMEQYLETSKYEPFDPFSHKGVWRQLTVRTSQTDDIMLIVVIHPQEMDEEEINQIKEDVKLFFTVGDGSGVGVTSLFFQQQGQQESGKEIEYEHIYGKTYIEETILGKTFKASPESFLQVNTPACEVLYNKVAEVAEIDSTSNVLDICCGVGTIGLCIAEGAYKLMGVELTYKAVEDARANAEACGMTNAVFYNGTAEDYIDNLIERSQRVNTIAIVDPPRSGLHGSVMNAIRKCEYLDRLVYVSCDPQAAVANFQALGRPKSKNYKGSFFVPIRAIPVDLFPDTPHFELIVLFERYDECKWDRIMSGNPRPKDQAYFDRVPELAYDYEKDLKEREEKRRVKERERKRNRSSRARDDTRRSRDWEGGRGFSGDWGGERVDRRSGRRSFERGREEDIDASMGRGGRTFAPREYRQSFGDGFQEGFQAGLEALSSQYPGFGQGGGWNMAQTPGQSGPQGTGGFSSNTATKGNQQGGNWGYGGTSGTFNSGPTSGAQGPNTGPSHHGFNSQQPVTYPASVTNPIHGSGSGSGSGSGYGYQSGGWNQNPSGSNWSGGGGGGGQGGGGQGGGSSGSSNQLGGSWNQSQYQSFDDPPQKKWKSGGDNQGYYNNY